MITVDSDIQSCLINCQTGNIRCNEFVQGSVGKVYLKFSKKKVGLKVMRSSCFGRQNYSVPIAKYKLRFQKNKRLASPSIKPT